MPDDPFAAYQQPAETAADPFAAYQHPITAPESKGFLGSLWDEVKKGPANLLGVGNSINQAVMHPIDTLEGMGKGISDMAGKTAESFKKGNYATAASQALNTGLNAVAPGLGSSSEEAGEKMRQGDIAGGLGQTAGIGINTALGIKTPQIVKGAANALPKPLNPGGSSLAALTRANPTVAATRALRPTPSDPGFTDRIPTTLSNVKAANAGAVPKGNAEMIPVVQKAIDSHQSVLSQWLDRAKGVKISGGPIIQATEEATQGMLPSEQPAAAAQIERARLDYGKEFTPQELKARLELLNKRIDSFASQSPGKQSAALADIPEAVLKAQRDATADTLYRGLDPEGQGAGPRLIQRQIGDMIELKNAALRRKNAITAEQPLSPLDKVAGEIKKIPKAVLPTRTGLAFSDSMQGKSDPLLRKAFNAVGEPNVPPKPGTDLYPTGDPQRLLGSGDMVPPAPPDTSFVRGAPGMNQPLNPRRALPSPDILTPPPPDTSYVRGVQPDAGQATTMMRKALPPGTAPFTQGTSVPDVLGRPPKPPYSRGLLAAPPPGEPPQTVLPRGPGSVQGPAYMPSSAGKPIPMEAAGNYTNEEPPAVGEQVLHQGKPAKVVQLYPDGTAEIQ